MDVEQLRQDVAEGTVKLDRLVELIASQQKLIQQLQAHVEQLEEQVGKLKEQIGKNPTERLDESYSEKAEDKRKAQAQGKPKKRKRSIQTAAIPRAANSLTRGLRGGWKTAERF